MGYGREDSSESDLPVPEACYPLAIAGKAAFPLPDAMLSGRELDREDCRFNDIPTDPMSCPLG
jgi:hypothetical protein